MAKTSDKISELFGLLPSGYFKDEEELRGFVQDENSLKEVYSFLPQGYFSDENEYVSYFGDAIKKKAPTTPSLDYSAMARGEKSLLEQVIGVSLKKPVAKQEGVSLEASPSPSQVKTVKEEKPKVAYEATNPTSISMLSQMEADKNRLLYMDDRIKSLQGEYEERVKKEQEALFKKYQSRAEANPDQVEKLQAEFEDEITKLSELRAAEFSQVATNLLGQKEYRYLGKKASSLSQLFQNVIEGAGNAATKDRQIEEIAQSVLTTVPDEVKEAVRGEINSIVMDVAGGSDLGSMYLMQKTIADKMGRLQQAKADLEVQYQEALAKWKNAPQEVLSSAYAAGEAMLPTGTGVPKELQEIQKQRVALNNALNTYEKVLRVPTARDWAGVEAWRETVPDILTAGMAGEIESLNVASLVSKQEKGQTTEAEDAIIDAYGTLQLMKGMASEEFNAYRRNQSIAGSIPYIEQFLLTGGAGSVARKAGIEASKRVVGGMINKFLREATKRVTRATVEGAVSAGLRTPLAPATYKNIAEASMGDFKIENGQFVVDEATRPSMVKAIVEGTYMSASDIFSESLGGIVDIPSKWLNRALTPTVRKVFQTIQLNGLHGELFEEIAAAIMQGEAVDREFRKDLLVTVPAMVGGMGVFATPATIANANNRAKRKDLIDTFGRDKITAIKDAIQAKDEDALVSLMSESGAKLIEEGMTPEKAQAKVKNLVEYATLYVAQTTKDEMSGAVEAKVEESVGAMPDELRAQPEAVQGELRFEPEIEETKPLTETSLTEKKAEIEQRRQDELTLTGKTIQWDNYGNEGMSEWNIGEKTKTRDGRDAVELWRQQEDDGGLSTFTQTVPIEEELLPKINAKYDAELAALETTSLTEEVPVKEQEEISVDMDWRYVRESIMGDRYLTPSEKKQAQTFARKLFEVGKSQGDVIARVNEKFGTNIKKQSTEPVSPPSDTQVSPTGESAAKAVPDNATGISQPVQHGSLTIPLEESYEGGADTTTYPIRVNGENRGKVDILSEQGISQIRWINVKRKETDTEMNGRNAYMTLRDQARARGDELISDIFFRRSAAAEKAWGRMVEDGLAVKVGNYYMFADAQNKEELAAKADKLEILRSIKGAAKAELVEGREAEVIQDFVDLTKDEFREKYKDHKDVNGLWMNARALDDLINTISRLSLSMEGGMKFTRKGLDLLRQSVTFAKDNNLTEKYGDISKIIGLLESEVQRRAGGVLEEERQETDAGDGGEANAGRGRGQVGRGTTDKTFKGSPIEKKPSPEVKRISDRLLTTQTTTKGENGPPDDTTQATEAKEGGKQREKSYLTRLYNSLKASDRLKKDIEEGGLLYSVLSNVQSSQDADAIIAEMGFAKAERYIRDRNNSIAGSTRNIIANRLGFHYDELASQAEAEGDFDAALEYAEKAYDIFNFVDYVSRDGGRFNQIGASAEISGLLTPKRAVARQKRQIREQRDSKLKAAEKEIKRLRKQLQEINEKAIDEVLGSKTYQQGRTATTKMPKVKAKAIADKIRKLKPSSFGLTFADPTGVTAVFEGAVALVAKTVELSGNIAEAINKGLEYIRNSAWYKSLNGGQQAEVDDKFIEGIQNQINEAVPQEGAEKKSPSQRLAERIDRMLKGPKPQKIDPVRQMIDTLFGKVKEQDTKEKVKPEKKSNIEKIREALEDKAQYAEVWEAAKKEVEFNIEANSELSDAQKQEYKARLEGFYNEMIGKPYSETQAEGATREAIRDMGIEIDKMVRQHYTVQDATARSLVDKLVEDLGLNEADAKMIADSVQKAFDKIATQRKRTILLQGLKARAKTAGTPKAAWERLIDLTNLGAFSNAEFAEAYADAMGFPKLTETQAKEMERLAGEIHKWTGFKKFEKIQDYLAYVAKLPGLDIGEVAMGMWYASILSGQRTQFKNILANTANLLAEWFVGMIYNGIRLDGSTVVMLNKGLGAGFGRGITEWRHVMATGYSSIRDNKIEMPNYMEQWRFKGGRFNPANWAKYVSRFMIATDAFFYSGLKEMRAHELAMVEAHKRNQETPQVTQSDYALASEILYKTSQRRAEAEAQADAEGLKGNERKKRIYDIMDGGRPTGMVAESSYFASKGTFNYKPEGVLGILTETISDVTNKLTLRPTIPFTGGRTVSIRIGKLFVPFTRIIANVANIALEYTPVGAVRAAKGTIGWEALNRNPDKQGFYRKLSGEERAKTAIRAAAGMIATYAFYALSEPGDDGEEPPLRITANGTGNYAKNQLLKDSKDGFHPYSIKIGGRWYSYQYTPLFLALAPIGLIRDNQRYKRDRGDEDIAPEDVIGAMLISTGSALSDMTWLASVSGLLEAFGSGDVGTFTNYLKRTTSSVSKGFVYPKAIEQTKQMIDDYYDNPKRFASGIFGKVVKDMPVVSNYFPIQYNVLGQPVTVDAVQMMDKGTSDPVASFVGRYWKETGGLSSVRQKSMLIYDVEKGKDRIITDVEFMNFIRVSGQEIARRLEEELMVNEAAMSPMEIGRAIKSIESDVRQKTKAEMFGWREWQTSDPKFWQEMINNRAVQIPISPKSLPIGEKKIPLTEEQLAEYNNIAMSKYIESLKDYFSDKREVEDNKAEMYDATTNTTVYDWRVKGLWQMAREAADWAMIEKIQAQQK